MSELKPGHAGWSPDYKSEQPSLLQKVVEWGNQHPKCCNENKRLKQALKIAVEAMESAEQTLKWIRPHYEPFVYKGTTQDPCGVNGAHDQITAALSQILPIYKEMEK